MANQNNKKKKYQSSSDEPVEMARSIVSDVVSGAAQDVVGGVASEFMGQVFGSAPKIDSGSRPDESIVFKEEIEKESGIAGPVSLENRQPGIELFNATRIAIERQIVGIRQELTVLIRELKDLPFEVEKAVEEIPVNPGIYHLAFFARLKQLIKFLRQKVEESRTWLSLMTSKKKQKTYWQMFKKHGTKFGLSSERVVATSSG